jgi:hypothetical protein
VDLADDWQVELLGLFPARQQNDGGAVVETRGVAGGDGAVFGKNRPQPGQIFRLQIRTDMFIGIEDNRVFFPLRDFNRDDFSFEPTCFNRGGSILMAAQGDFVLGLAADIIFARQIFRSLAHDVAGLVEQG